MAGHQGIDNIFRLHILGVGNYFSENHSTVAFALQAGKKFILIEAPFQSRLRLARYRDAAEKHYWGGKAEMPGIESLTLENIHEIIVTHDDGDHSMGLEDIALFNWYVRKPSIRDGARKVRIYSTPDVASMLESSYSPRLRVNRCEYRDVFDVVCVAPENTVNIGDLNLSVCEADHGKPAFGMLLKHKDGRTVSYSGDTRFNNHLIDFLSQADVLVHECTGFDQVHTTPEQLRAWLDRSRYEEKGKLYTCHYSTQDIPLSKGLTPLEENRFYDIKRK